MTRRFYKQLRMAQLRALVHLSKSGSFTQVATELDLSTPSVWQQIRGLEQILDQSLVRSVGQRVCLTEHGKRLCELAETTVQSFDAIFDEFGEASQSIPRRITVASPAAILLDELPATLKSFCDAHPNVELNIVDLPSQQARKLLEDGEADIAVVGHLGHRLPKSIVADPVAELPFMIVCCRDHPLARATDLSPRALIAHPQLMSASGTNTRDRLEAVFGDAGLLDEVRVVTESNTKDVLLQFASLNMGFAIAPISTNSPYFCGDAGGHLAELVFRDAREWFGVEEVVLLRRKSDHLSPLMREFRDFLLDQVPVPTLNASSGT